MNAINIGKHIAALRKERGLTQDKLAELLNISPQAVSKWENGHSLPDTSLLPSLAKALDCSIDSILTESKLQILSAFYGDGIEKHDVTGHLNRLIENDRLVITVSNNNFAWTAKRPAYLTVKFTNDSGTFYKYYDENSELDLNSGSEGCVFGSEGLKIIGAYYGSSEANNPVMHKIEHYHVFNRNNYSADHETFPSSPQNEEQEYLSIIYINADGIHIATCEEGEKIAYNEKRTALSRYVDTNKGEYYVPFVPRLPAFGEGWECSWAAALTAALQALGRNTTYEHVMGVSGACYRLAFCSPGWDYSSVDGLVAYNYAIPAYKAFGYEAAFADRVTKLNRSKERKKIIENLRCGLPVLGINLRIAAEWGVICGYDEKKKLFFCRTKYDYAKDFPHTYTKNQFNSYDYFPVDNWPFIITYFGERGVTPGDKENLLNSLRVFIDYANMPDNGCSYYMGFEAYEAWSFALTDEEWYNDNDDEQVERRLSVDQFCTLALYDARRCAHIYLNNSIDLLSGKEKEMLAEISLFFKEISEKAREIHEMLDTGEYLQGKKARAFFAKELRQKQAALLDEMSILEQNAAKKTQELLSSYNKYDN